MANQAMRRGIMLGVLGAAALLSGCAGMGESKPAKERVVLQVSDADPRTWNQAMNVVGNLKRNYAKRGVDSEIQIVAFGQGIQMLKDDAVVANRVRETMKGGATMVACENSMGVFKLTKDMMVDNISYSETGVIYIIEKQRQGWSVIRP
jgi:intracellular sulfur oxidation DsrE/DsrF family protein